MGRCEVEVSEAVGLGFTVEVAGLGFEFNPPAGDLDDLDQLFGVFSSTDPEADLEPSWFRHLYL